ncbi:hypothetical protein ABID22_000126 [Pontibacter aydingkolensis]|uniref:Uncharacterized protein n=1 Tax=Pontibacter aydingkolensis TaxID=1911536 RepID=A0ABS7CQS7_9BACT|nr:hypothetical protein [Pontibacter aydingkolensis]MBW7466206.1 hypothetical protein [Pontibacter aydingkolensis]
MQAQDFLLNEDGDLAIVNGDLVAGDSDNQHVWDILISHKGWYKEFPFVGVGLQSYLKSAGMQQELKSEIQIQLQSDGYKVKEVTVGDLEKMEIEWDVTRII